MPKNPKNRAATGLKAYYFLIVCMLFPFMLKAETGSISGKVLDAETGGQLIGAAVFIEGTSWVLPPIWMEITTSSIWSDI